MSGCDVVYYCVVDARMWLRDPAPLFRTNVEGLRQVLEAAADADLRKFVFTSTTGTLAVSTRTRSPRTTRTTGREAAVHRSQGAGLAGVSGLRS